MYAKTFIVLAMAAFVVCAPGEENAAEQNVASESSKSKTAASSSAGNSDSSKTPLSAEEIKKLKPKDDDTVVKGMATSSFSSMKEVNGKVVDKQNKEDAVYNDNGNVTEYHSKN